MKKPAARKRIAPSSGARQKVHPVVIYPFRQPTDFSDLEELYMLIGRLDAEKEDFARPITVMDRKTFFANDSNKRFLEFRKETVSKHSDIIDAWCVDTCQMWYTGLGAAFERGGPDDVYWLIPGDFNYGSAVGKEVLGRLHDLPEICVELEQDVCIGEIATDHNNSKQLIDTYGTFALLYSWFPTEAQEIRQYTERPRSEFFAIRHSFLREVLRHRWYAYEQTVVILLQAVFSNRRISRFLVGNISDLPEGRENYASAMQQVERTERVLKQVWRERNQPKPRWAEEYRVLEAQSEQARRTALTVLQKIFCARFIMNHHRPGYKPHVNLRAVTFMCVAPQAQAVTLVGDFNHWKPSSHPMKHMPDKSWHLTVELKHGHHRYAFLVDGQLTLDPRAQGITRNDQGERVSLIPVS